MTFNGKVALVTGGTSGIGKETAVQLAQAGAKVVLAGRRSEEGNAVVAQIKAAGGEAVFGPADSGIYLDDHVEPFSRISRFMKQFGAVPGIQIAHAGRKASANKTWEGDNHIETGKDGWDTIAPSAVPLVVCCRKSRKK